ncbi:IctB family putative bicarbonate transporter [Synechocystis sp. LKSZ1]|uniref:IctB family putative bicarbonate transporter n=1 Tax=Synechocystis sp. LKSZ1 TaxID=3144951 RepID=UPI00336BC93E
MAFFWQQLTWSRFSPYQWRQGSYLHRLVGLFQGWSTSSYLWPFRDAIGALLIALIFSLAPFTSTTMLGGLLTICGLYWLVLTLADEQSPGLTPIHLLVFLYWLISALAVSFSPVKMAALGGFLKLTANLCLFLLAARILRSRPWFNRVVTVIILVGLTVGAYGIKQQLDGVEQLATWNDPTSDLAGATRVYSYLGNPNLLAAYLLPMIALSCGAIFTWRGILPKLLAMMTLAIDLGCLFFTQSRGGWLGGLAVLGAFIFLSYLWWRPFLSPFWQTWLLPLVIGLGGLGLGLALLLVEPLQVRVLSIFAGRGDSSNNFRINVWEGVKSMIRDRPWLGIGPGNSAFNHIYPLYMRPKFSALSAYSIYLEIMVETGLVGFSTMLWLLLVVFSQGLRQIQAFRHQSDPQGFWAIAALAAMVGLLVHGLVDTVWYRPPVSTLWWFLLAMIASQSANLMTAAPATADSGSLS